MRTDCCRCLGGIFQKEETPSAKALRGKSAWCVLGRAGGHWLVHNVCVPWRAHGLWCLPASPLLPTHSDDTSSASIHSVSPPAWSPTPSPFPFFPMVTCCVHPAPSRVLWSRLQPLAGGLAFIYLFSSVSLLLRGRNCPARFCIHSVQESSWCQVGTQSRGRMKPLVSDLAITKHARNVTKHARNIHSGPPGDSTSQHTPARNSHLH